MFTHAVVAGHLGKDPETKYMENGNIVTNFSLASSYGSGDKKKTNWYDVEIWGKLGERASEWLNKGTAVLVSGRLDIRKWESKNTGEKGTTVVIVAEGFRNLNPKEDQENTHQQSAQGAQTQQPQYQQKLNHASPSQQPQQPYYQQGPPVQQQYITDPYTQDIPY